MNQIVERKLADRRTQQPEGECSYASVVAALPGGTAGGPGLVEHCSSPGRGKEDRKEDNYWRCRRALRLRPIGPGNVKEEVLKFMEDHLKLSSYFIESVGPFTAQRVPYGPAAKIKDEVIVSYHSTDVRDAVKAAAKNLAGKGRDFGVRLELPNHLKSAMKALQSVSYELKTKFPEARRNVLFDDETMDLVLDFCTREGEPWKRLNSAQASARKKKKPAESGSKSSLRDGELESLLDGSEEEEEHGINCG